jgi:hypothetical protein
MSLRGPAEGAADSYAWRGGLGAVGTVLLTLAFAIGLGTFGFAAIRDDSGPGTTTPVVPGGKPACTATYQPRQDLGQLVNGLHPGDVACLAPGDYGAKGTRTNWRTSGIAGKPIVVRAASPGSVQVHGFVDLAASWVVADSLIFDGPTGYVNPANEPHGEEVLLWAQGDHLLIRGCEVRNGLWRAGIYVGGDDVMIDSCWVHDIGPWSQPEQDQIGGRAANTDHGIYWGGGHGGRLVNSVLEHNLAYGLQINGNADGVQVVNNTIVRNGTGGVIWADDASGSTLLNNIIAFNGGYGLNAHLLTGIGNVARNNLGWGNALGEWNDNGPLSTRGNLVGDPLFVSDRDYRLRGGSPAVDAGETEGAPANDRDGYPRKGAGPDIGACERIAG